MAHVFVACHPRMPDAFGLTFAAVIALLCADYRFETLPWPRLLAILLQRLP